MLLVSSIPEVKEHDIDQIAVEKNADDRKTKSSRKYNRKESENNLSNKKVLGIYTHSKTNRIRPIQHRFHISFSGSSSFYTWPIFTMKNSNTENKNNQNNSFLIQLTE